VSHKNRKPGRPKLPKGEAKGKIVPIRFTKAEAEQLTEAANRNNLTLFEWDSSCGACSAEREGTV
jgi:hypothetical protein